MSQDAIRCYFIDQTDAPGVAEFRGYTPRLVVDKERFTTYDAEKLRAALTRALQSSGHQPVRHELRTMTSTRDNTRKSLYLIMYFSSWDARRHCINVIKKYYDADIHFTGIDATVEFLSYIGLSFTGWFTAEMVLEKGTLVCHDISTVRRIEIQSVPRPMILSFDIECYSHGHLGMPRSYERDDSIVMISMVFSRYKCDDMVYYVVINPSFVPAGYVPRPWCIIADTEHDMIEHFARLTKLHDPDLVVGYNIFGFDVPYIHDRMSLGLKDFPDMSRCTTHSTSIKDVDWFSSAFGHNVMKRLQIEGRCVVDVLNVFRRRRDLESASLSEVSKRFLKDDKMDIGSLRMAEMLADITQSHLDTIVDYCVKDSVLVLRLVDHVDAWVSWVEESGICRVQIDELYTRGTGVRIVNQLYHECYIHGVVMREPCMPTYDFEGGHVFDPPQRRYENCTSLDFRSLYPSIMMQYNICMSTYVDDIGSTSDVHVFHVNGRTHAFRRHPEGILPCMLRRLIDERGRVRSVMQSMDDMEYRSVLDQRQNMLKISANAIYGVLGSQESRYMRHFPCGETVTYIGRQYVSDLRAFIESNYRLSVPYGDTDSSYIHGGDTSAEELIELTKRVVDHANSVLPEHIKVAYEGHYDVVIFLTKKRYIMCSGDKITNKGVVTARRGVCRYAKDTYRKVLSLAFRRGTTRDDILECIEKAYRDLVLGRVSLDNLVVSRSIRKEYMGNSVPQKIMIDRLRTTGVKLTPGTRVEFVFVRNSATLQGEKMYTTDEAKSGRYELDYDYYLEHQMSKSLHDLTCALGYGGVERVAYCRCINAVKDMM